MASVQPEVADAALLQTQLERSQLLAVPPPQITFDTMNNIDSSLKIVREHTADGKFLVHVAEGEDSRLQWAVACSQGRRPKMEDCYAVQLDLEGTGDGTSMFALFDGHAGREVAIFAARHLPTLIVQTEAFAHGDMRNAIHQSFLALDELLENPVYQAELFALNQGLQVLEAPKPSELAAGVVGGTQGPATGEPPAGPMHPAASTARPTVTRPNPFPSSAASIVGQERPPTADVTHPAVRTAQVLAQLPSQVVQRSEGFGTFDAAGRYIGPKAGSTAIVALIRSGVLVVGSVGDSRCVLGREGRALDLTREHKPDDPVEAARIYSAGLDVRLKSAESVPRVGGRLAMSRAIGDAQYKDNLGLPAEQQAVTAVPETRQLPILGAPTDFLILASDGLWESLVSSEAVDFVYKGLAKNESLPTIARNLVSYCLESDKPCPSKDNITAALVLFKQPAL